MPSRYYVFDKQHPALPVRVLDNAATLDAVQARIPAGYTLDAFVGDVGYVRRPTGGAFLAVVRADRKLSQPEVMTMRREVEAAWPA